MQPDHPLAVAARMIDDLGTQKGYAEALREMGLDVDDVEYMAKQRAYRMWLLVTGGEELLAKYNTGRRMPMPPMTQADENMIDAFTMMSAAGIALGWTGRSVSDGFVLNDETHY